MVLKRDAPEVGDTVPDDDTDWTVGGGVRMRVEVTMPNLGYDMEDGNDRLVARRRWATPSQRGEPIAEIETDKTTVEMESLATGTLVEIVHAAGAEVAVGDVDRLPRDRRLTWTGSLVERRRRCAQAIARRMTREQARRAALLRRDRGRDGRRRSARRGRDRARAERPRSR